MKVGQTALHLARQRPDEVWLQMPPTVKLYVAALYKAVRPRTTLVADCHNGTLREPWISTPGLVWMLSRVVDVVLVHNHVVLERALAAGFPPDRTFILETSPARPDAAPAQDEMQHPYVIFPASFMPDEPIEALLDAARRLPWVRFIVTGDAREAVSRGDLRDRPENVVLSGWVDREAYRGLLFHADAVVGLTLYEGVQLSVANEATGFGKAMVLSDTRLLRELFHSGAVYVAPRSEDIARGIEEALSRRESLEQESAELRTKRVQRWAAQATAVLERLEAV